MKIFQSILIFVCFNLIAMENASGQVKNYEAQWKKIDELVQKNQLPKSALAEVKKIYTQAKAEKQDAQVIKALVYMIRLQEENQEDAELLSIKQIEKEIPTSKEPAASILNNLLANLYWQYLQEHRWELYNRTNTVDFNKSDIATWTLEDLHKKISEVFLASIKNENVLKQTKLEPFDAIIVKGNVRNLRPTLFDLLAHHALQYFSNTERDIKKPAYAFEITQPQAFDMAADFASFKFKTNDSLSLQYKALLIYQDLIRFHLKDPKPDALVDVDLARIDYVYHNSVSDEKDSLYTIALVNTIQKYRGNAMAKQASYMLAAWYEQKANTYQPLKDTQYRYARNEAHRILQEAVNDSSLKNEGWTNSFNLLKEIERKSFSFEVEKVNIPGQPFRALVKYKNTDQLYFRLVKQDETLKQALENRDEQKTWNTLLQAKTVKSWQQSLRATGDMQQHSTEIKIDGLPVGVYYLLASTAQDFNQKKGPLGRQSFYVSNISHANQGNKYFVLDRETGQPLRTAAIQVFKQEYNYKTEKYARTKIGSYRADDHGMFTVELPKENRYVNFYLDITTKDDHLFIDEAVGNYYYYDNDRPTVEETATRIFFFTDRSIYRPGQLVYFKGIVVKTKKTANSIAANYSTTVYLYDANNEKLDSMKVVTNEFGSFNGKFNLPQGTLNGEFIIATKDMESSTEFSVEEYKRPKFHVEFEKIKETYKAGDVVTVTGAAKAYAGNNIDGGKLAFRVVRRPRFIYTWFFRKSWLPPVEEMEIAHGEATTDKDGKFIIQFTAIPDKKLDPKMDPVFDYEVFADVTDINGETRSASKTVTAGYKSLILRVDLPEKIPIDSLKKITVRTENMNGDFQSSMVEVSIRKLIPADNRLIRQRYWEEPDEFVMSKEEYIRYFPHDEYQHETEFTSWDKGELVATKKDTTSENGQFPINNVQFSSGYYAIEVTTKDKDGKEVKDTKYVELFDAAAKNFNKPEYLWTKASDGLVEPGTNTEVQVGSSASNVYLINQVSKRDQEKSDFNYLSISNEKKSIMYTATEADRGGYGTNFFFVKDNRLYQFNDVINVPWSNKNLDIEYSSFRDKTLPGSEEKWKLKITGYKNELAAAEMLASMYDASLDQFRMHEWDIPGIWPLYASYLNWNGQSNFTSVMSSMQYSREDYRQFDKQYDRLFFDNENIQYDNVVRLRGRADGVMNYSFSNRESIPKVESAMGLPPVIAEDQMAMKQHTAVGYFSTADTTRITDVSNFKSTDNKNIEPSIQPRKNFNETAFFFPELRTDANGAIEFSFNAPEALTKWKFQSLVHTKALAFGYSQKEIVTQKELMVQPNMPRFLRQGDHMELVAKIVNMSDSELTGQAQLELFDATTNQSVDGWFINTFPNQYFTVAAGQSEVVKFPIQVPFQFNNALTWRITARSGNYSDGEEDAMPVLTNKTLVTETMPLPMRGTGTKEFSFEKLLKSGSSESLQHHSLTVEYTSNPAWYAVQALPYLMEYPYDCAEQVWNRYYANALATKIVNAAPRIKEIFKKWKNIDTAALLSNLQKNQELKSALLEETPWVLEAKTETEQKKNIALLFDMVHMSNELAANLDKLHQAQSPNGGFVWFKGGPDDRYITQYIISSIGHLKKLGVDINKLNSVIGQAIPYLDKKIKEDYDNLVKNKADLSKQYIGYYEIQYLYMRSFFPEIAIPQASQTAYNYYKKQAQQFWVKQNKYLQGMMALALYRAGDKQIPAAILKSLKETSISNNEMGMYWKDNSFGFSWNWWYAPIETQSLMIEAFSEIAKDTKTTDDLKTWLIKNKQTNNWRTTKATADACYAMLLQGTNWLSNEPVVQIKLGNTTISSTDQEAEAGTGYFKQSIDGQKVKPEMGKISVSVNQPLNSSTDLPSNSPSWGSVYWQYFEDLDKITSASTPLQLKKKLFIEKNTDRGPVLTPVEDGTELHVGDKIKVRIELRVDRDMEYMHMKDMRAAALEPVNVLSGYKYQGGLGYYESTKDASTNFFFNYLKKGTYVFEYPLFVSHTGNFSNGITTIQCMYAPEFSAHSEGVRLSIE